MEALFVSMGLVTLAEMGDKTRLLSLVLAARYHALLQVVVGTTLGMMLANVPVVWLGERLTRRLPIALVHRISALIFAVLGLLALPGFKASV